MKNNAEPIEKLITELEKFPGVGRKSAERMAFHVLRSGASSAHVLSNAINEVVERVRECDECGSFAEAKLCEVCADSKRDRTTICVVEMPRDVAQIEKSGAFNGLYHCLMGRISPLDGMGAKDLRLRELVARIKKNRAKELIIATNPTAEGDATATYIERALEDFNITITRPARGIPTGSEIEYVDGPILASALRARQPARGGGANGS